MQRKQHRKKDYAVQVYLDPIVKEKLTEKANKENRSISSMAATILTFNLTK